MAMYRLRSDHSQMCEAIGRVDGCGQSAVSVMDISARPEWPAYTMPVQHFCILWEYVPDEQPTSELLLDPVELRKFAEPYLKHVGPESHVIRQLAWTLTLAAKNLYEVVSRLQAATEKAVLAEREACAAVVELLGKMNLRNEMFSVTCAREIRNRTAP